MNLPRNTLFRYLDDIPASVIDIAWMKRVMEMPIAEAIEITEDECFEERKDAGLEA